MTRKLAFNTMMMTTVTSPMATVAAISVDKDTLEQHQQQQQQQQQQYQYRNRSQSGNHLSSPSSTSQTTKRKSGNFIIHGNGTLTAPSTPGHSSQSQQSQSNVPQAAMTPSFPPMMSPNTISSPSAAAAAAAAATNASSIYGYLTSSLNTNVRDEHITARNFAYLEEGSLLFSCGHWDWSVRVTSAETGRLLHVLIQHHDVVTCLAVCKDYGNRWLVTGSRDCTVIIWDIVIERNIVTTVTPIRTLYGHDDAVTCVAMNHEMDIVISGSEDGTWIMHNLRDGKYVRTIPNYEAPPMAQLPIPISPSSVRLNHGSNNDLRYLNTQDRNNNTNNNSDNNTITIMNETNNGTNNNKNNNINNNSNNLQKETISTKSNYSFSTWKEEVTTNTAAATVGSTDIPSKQPSDRLQSPDNNNLNKSKSNDNDVDDPTNHDQANTLFNDHSNINNLPRTPIKEASLSAMIRSPSKLERMIPEKLTLFADEKNNQNSERNKLVFENEEESISNIVPIIADEDSRNTAEPRLTLPQGTSILGSNIPSVDIEISTESFPAVTAIAQPPDEGYLLIDPNTSPSSNAIRHKNSAGTSSTHDGINLSSQLGSNNSSLRTMMNSPNSIANTATTAVPIGSLRSLYWKVTWIGISNEGYIITYSADQQRLATFTLNGTLIAVKKVPEALYCFELSEDGTVLITGGSACLVVFRWVRV
jgi:hypothetical protein